MDTNEFTTAKQEVLSLPICYREIGRNEIVSLDATHYQVGNVAFEVQPRTADKIDRFVGISRGQSQVALTSYGEPGVTNLRNFFGQANDRSCNHIVLAANTEKKQIVDAIPIRERMITPDAFFDFAEMFMDKHAFEPESVEFNYSGQNGISIRMKPIFEEFLDFTPDDPFLINGLYLKWMPGEISLGNYYKRLVCSNGSTQESRHTITKVFSPEPAKLGALLDISTIQSYLKLDFDKMYTGSRLAMRTTASVHELGIAANILTKHGVHPLQTKEIVPYEQAKEEYQQAGYPTDAASLSQSKSRLTMWEVFNLLTYFASHNQNWSQHDLRRTLIMEASMSLLMRERDIKEYYNIY